MSNNNNNMAEKNLKIIKIATKIYLFTNSSKDRKTSRNCKNLKRLDTEFYCITGILDA